MGKFPNLKYRLCSDPDKRASESARGMSFAETPKQITQQDLEWVADYGLATGKLNVFDPQYPEWYSLSAEAQTRALTATELERFHHLSRQVLKVTPEDFYRMGEYEQAERLERIMGISKSSTPKIVRDYWDEHLEYNALRTNVETGAGAFLSAMLETAGDIIRELGKDIPNAAYIQEKILRIKNNLRAINWRLLLSPREKGALRQIQQLIRDMPTPTPLYSKFKELLEAITARDARNVGWRLADIEEMMRGEFSPWAEGG
jgi:hypothetical protein